MVTDLQMAELLVARFCHDLAGPLGAISNGLEFLHDNNTAMHTRAVELMDTSITESIARLQFFRAAFGSTPAAGSGSHYANLESLRQLTCDFFASTKCTIDWDLNLSLSLTEQVSHRHGKLILIGTLIAATMLIYGGTITIDMTQFVSQKRFSIRAEGKEVKTDIEQQALLTDRDIRQVIVSSKNVPFLYARRVAEEISTPLKLQVEENSMVLTIG